MPTNITSLYNGIFSDPEKTLRRNFIYAFNGSHGAWKYSFFQKDDNYLDGFTTGRSGRKGLTKKRPRISFQKGPAASGQFDLTIGEFDAYYFPMIKDAHPTMAPDTNTNCLEIPRNPGQNDPKIVWTGQLTACHVAVWRGGAGNIRLCHIQPMTPQEGAQCALNLNTSLKRHNHIDNVTIPGMKPLGRNVSILVKPSMGADGPATGDYCYFIGVFRKLNWNFFCYHRGGASHLSFTTLAALDDGTYEY